MRAPIKSCRIFLQNPDLDPGEVEDEVADLSKRPGDGADKGIQPEFLAPFYVMFIMSLLSLDVTMLYQMLKVNNVPERGQEQYF